MPETTITRVQAITHARQHGHALGEWVKPEYAFITASCGHDGCIAYAFDTGKRIELRGIDQPCPVPAMTRASAMMIAAEFGHCLQPFAPGTSGHDVAYCTHPNCYVCVTATPNGGSVSLAYGLGYECPAPS